MHCHELLARVALLAFLGVEGWTVQVKARILLEVRPLFRSGHRTKAEFAAGSPTPIMRPRVADRVASISLS